MKKIILISIVILSICSCRKADELPPLQNRAEREQMLAFGIKNLPKSEAYRLRSPLLRIVNGKKVLDIPAWLKKINQGKAPDFIVFQLGTNDISSATPETIKTHYETLISFK